MHVDWIGILKLFGPQVLTAINPNLGHIADKVVATAADVEAAKKDGMGAEKKADVMQAAADAIDAVNTTGKVHLDPTSTLDSADRAIDTLVSVVNAIHTAQIPPKV